MSASHDQLMPVNHYRSALATLCLASLAAPATAQSLDNEGTEFLCAFLPQLGIVENQAVELHLTSRVPTTATIEYPAGAPTFSTTVNVVPGAIEIVGVPTDAAQAWAFDTVQTNLVSVTADEEVTAYMINRANFTSDAALALPVDTLNTEFIVVDYESPGATQSSASSPDSTRRRSRSHRRRPSSAASRPGPRSTSFSMPEKDSRRERLLARLSPGRRSKPTGSSA